MATHDKPLDFSCPGAQPHGRRSPVGIRRSRNIARRSPKAEALAPALDTDWYEAPPLEAYADMETRDELI